MATDSRPTSDSAAATRVENLDTAEAAARLDEAANSGGEGIAILDVRTPDEFRRGHLANAANLDFRAPGFEEALAAIDRHRTVLVHCAGGGRSTRSLDLFRKLGFRSVIHLDGGYDGWQKAGFPVEIPAGSGADNEAE